MPIRIPIVQVYRAADGTHLRSIGSHGSGAGQFIQPHGVCVSPNGEWLFVADCGNHRVQVLRMTDGEHVHTIGSRGGGDGQLQFPMDVCLSPDGNLLIVSDMDNHRVQVFTA